MGMPHKDVKGQKFGMLTAIECVGKDSGNRYKWRCLCDCGNESVVVVTNLTTGSTASCGCARMKIHGRKRKQQTSEYRRKVSRRRQELIAERKANGFAGFEHGTVRTYRSGCRCDPCTKASAKYVFDLNARTKETVKRMCGTVVSYRQGCRCEICVHNNSVRYRAHKHKLPFEVVDAMIRGHDMKCEICFVDISDDWCMDHCHTTGDVRGLLCSTCNSGIGMFRDDAIRIERARDYLCNYLNKKVMSLVKIKSEPPMQSATG